MTRTTFALVLALAFALPTLAGCVTPGAEIAPASASPLVPERPSVVIAVIDTGINFYHNEYRLTNGDSPLSVASADTLTKLGVPEILDIPLSLDVTDWDKAVEADMDALMTMEPRKLYTFPGTRILGAISFQDKPEDWPVILDHPERYTHGTMTTSRAIGNTVSIGGAEPDIYLVMVQGFNTEALQWVADQSWIDIASISAGLSPMGVVPGVPLLMDKTGLMGEGAIPTYNYLSHRKPFFASTGNGIGNAGTVGYPSWSRGSSGVPDVLSVGANNNDEMSHWHNQDGYISADGCANPAADPGSTEDVTNSGGGTSSATPFSAGGGAKLLLEARRILHDTKIGARIAEPSPTADGWTSGRADDDAIILAQGEAGLVTDGPLADGILTLTEFKQTMYMTALAVPTDDESDGEKCAPLAGGFPGGENLPAAARFPLHGYGEINHASIEAAIAVLKGDTPMPARPDDDAQYAMARERKMMTVGDAE